MREFKLLTVGDWLQHWREYSIVERICLHGRLTRRGHE